MVTTLMRTPIHRREGNFYEMNGKFKLRETKKSYIIESEIGRLFTIPKRNTVQPHTSLFDLPDDLVFFFILHHDIGTFELIYKDSKGFQLE